MKKDRAKFEALKDAIELAVLQHDCEMVVIQSWIENGIFHFDFQAKPVDK